MVSYNQIPIKSENYVELTPNVVVHKSELSGSSIHEQRYNFSERISQANIRIDDLDKQLTWYNLGEKIATDKMGVDSFNDKVSYLIWGLEGIGELHRAIREKKSIFNVEKLKENHWKEYHELFLRCPYNTLDGFSESMKQNVVESIEKLLTRKEIIKSLYPGVKELNDKLRTTNILISRNLEPVLRAYVHELKYDFMIADAFDKVSALKEVINKFPDKRKLIIRGDGGLAEIEMVKYAKGLMKEKKLDDVIPILREQQENLYREDMKEFTVRVGTNDYGLVYLLNMYLDEN